MTATTEAVTLRMLRCARCGRVDTPTRSVCVSCLSGALEPVDVPGTGVLVSWTTIRRAPTRFRDDAPYDVAVVDLDDGQRVVGRLAADSASPAPGCRVLAISADGANAIFKVTTP